MVSLYGENSIDTILGREQLYNALSEEQNQKILAKIEGRKPKSFDEFAEVLKVCGYEVKGGENKYISVRAKGQKKFTRLKSATLGEAYTKNSITDFIESSQGSDSLSQPTLNKFIDIKAKSSPGFAYWAKLQNLKTLVDTHSYLVENNLNFDDMKALVYEKEVAISNFEIEKESIQNKINRQKEISILRNHLISYVKNRKIFDEYKKSGYNKTFKEQNAEILESFNETRKYFDEYKKLRKIEKLPSMAEIKEEYAELKSARESYYEELKTHKEELKLLKILKSNAMELLGVDGDGEKLKSEKEVKQERIEAINTQKERILKQQKYKKKQAR